MKTIDEIQKQIIDDFHEMGDSFEQYAYLIELSCTLPPMDDSQKTPERMVDGCQSHVWLDIRHEDGFFQFDADSDTLIVKGVLYLLEELFNGQNPEDVAKAEITFLRETAIMDTFESDRQKGIGYVLKTLQTKAAEMI